MKKYLVCIILLVLVTPTTTSAMFIMPYFDILLRVHSNEESVNFNFQVSAYNPIQYLNSNIEVLTSDGYGSSSVQTYYANGGSLYINIIESGDKLWNITTFNCSSANSNVIFSHENNGIKMSALPFSSVECEIWTEPANQKDPILIIPGVLGTNMYQNDKKLWLDLFRMAYDVGDNFLDHLQFDSGLGYVDDTVTFKNVLTIEQSPIGFGDFDYAQGLISGFLSQGYTEGENLFTFPYDWRYGVSGKEPDGTTNVDHLKGQIEYILTQTEAGRSAGKVNVIAHSTGGLLVKKYVMDYPTDHHIDKAVFVGVPNTGAPKAIKVLTVGDSFGIPWLDQEEMKKISKNLPVVYDLAPSQAYYNDKGSYYRIVETSVFSPSSAGSHQLNYAETWMHLAESNVSNSLAVEQTEQLHTSAFDNYDMRSAGVDMYNLVGCKTGSIGMVVEERYKNYAGNVSVNYKNPLYTPGDGTVPLESATHAPVDSSKKYYALKADHSKMMSQDGIRQQIINILTGSNLEVGSDITQDISQCKLNGKAYAVYSPVNFEVNDSYGNSLGIAEDGSVYNTIPNASLDVFNDHKFMYLPEEGQYTIKLKGTGTGTFTLVDQEIINNQSGKTQVFSNVPVTPALEGLLQDNGNNIELTLDTNGDGTADKTISPSSVITPEQAQDVLAPVSSSTITGLAGEPGFYRSDVSVNLFANDVTDAENPDATAGVLAIHYTLDNQATTTYAGTFNIAGEGVHTLSFFATDRAGNNEELKTVEFVIDTTPPELIMQFSPKDQDMVFTATDSLVTLLTTTSTPKQTKFKAPRVVDSNSTITATDSAGNVTVLTLNGKNRKRDLKADIKSLSYNGKPANLNKATMHFDWLFDRKGALQILTQKVTSKKDFAVFGLYALGKTLITGRNSNGKINKTLKGTIIFKVKTNKGDLEWGY